ncbi:hypothetical protein [Eilatimonas milleporae]|uniref:Hemolysin type calcium-binding protein n=1 Tax=Eilatimonas milleporae TaxID=911205 RepID=A0A3M0CLZ7_9PROT|nr:hypothetical protein [Eilatimonas milleporae]RMB08069.1 hemolysin type calcium-binding protein [Eilatimonas milleporae]
MTTRTVMNTNDGGAGSLRQVIEDASAGDTITFDGSLDGETITLGGNVLIINKDLIIDGDLDDDNTPDITISGGNANRVFAILDSNVDVTLDGLVITDGAYDVGPGGGLLITQATVTITDSIISNNETTTDGGGVYGGNGANITISNSTITGNSGQNGGGISINGNSTILTIDGTTVSNNEGRFSGGGLEVDNDATVIITDSSFTGNTASSDVVPQFGGAGITLSGSATLANVTISGNTSANVGGGLILTDDSAASLYNVTISGNAAENGGGGISHLSTGALSIQNSIVLGNASTTGGDEFRDDNLGNTTFTGTNLIGADASAFDASVDAAVINADPTAVFANTVANGTATAGVLADNGGPVQTIALSAGPSNPALDVGTGPLSVDFGAGPVDVTTDAVGNARGVDQTLVDNGGPVDAGAVELQTVLNAAPRLVIADGTLAYTEGDGATQIDGSATVSDDNGDADWDGGTLAIQISGNPQSNDRISIDDTDGDGTVITISGTDILANGTDVGDLSASGGTVIDGAVMEGAILRVTFDADATNDIVQEVLQSVRYDNASDAPGTFNRTVRITATDANNGSSSDTRTISFTAENDAPVFTGLDGAPGFTQGQTAVQLDADVTISDAELDAANRGNGNYAGASLTIARTGGADAGDRLSVVSGGDLDVTGGPAGGGTIAVAGNVIATIADTGNGQLRITFTDANGTNPTTTDLVNEVMQAIRYANAGTNPPASVRLDWTFNDGNSGDAQGTGGAGEATGAVTVTVGSAAPPPPPPPNTPPTTGGGSAGLDAGAAYTLRIGDFGFSDADGDAFVSVLIDSLPEIGTLTLNGVAVSVGQSIRASEISAGRLVYTSDGRGADARFTFRVSDGEDTSGAARFDLLVADPEPDDPGDPGDPGNGGGEPGDDLEGTPAADTLIGGDADDVVRGQEGDDNIRGAGGDDEILAGERDDGNDTLSGGTGNDTLGGGVGDDSIDGGDDDDILFGREGRDTLLGGDGNDIIFTGDGDDTVNGGFGNDTIWGSDGDDLLIGGAGSDTFTFGRLAGNDRVADFDIGDDALHLRHAVRDFESLDDVEAAARLSVDGNGNPSLVIDLGPGEDGTPQSVSLSGLTLADLQDMTILI